MGEAGSTARMPPQLAGSDSSGDEAEPYELPRHLFVDYEHEYLPYPSDEFGKYVRRVTSPVSQAPTSFRFLFVRRAETKLDGSDKSEHEKQLCREALARQMLTSIENWMATYASPRTRVPLPHFAHASNVVFDDEGSD